MKILLATDGSPCSDVAVTEVARRPWPAGSEVKVISVFEIPVAPAVEPWAIPPDYFKEVEKAARESSNALIGAAVSKLRAGEDQTLKVTGEVMEGSPKRAILDEAEQLRT